MKLVYRWLQSLFLRHELWALRCSIEWPLVALLILQTLNLWWVLPGFVFSLLGILFFVNGFTAMAIVVGALGLLVILPTFVRGLEWYFTAIGLMLGTGASARRRLAELENSEGFIPSVSATEPRASDK